MLSFKRSFGFSYNIRWPENLNDCYKIVLVTEGLEKFLLLPEISSRAKEAQGQVWKYSGK